MFLVRDHVVAALLILLLGAGAGTVSAQYPPPREGVTVLKSKFHENVTISFKETHICETTPGVQSYAGYVHLPPGFLDDGEDAGGRETQDYPINTYFHFFPSRLSAPEHSPLAIWLNGGPGGSSMMGMLEENGPCLVNADSRSTSLNPWSWNNYVNMLYVDQPVQVGFSYDVAVNGTRRLVWNDGGDVPGWEWAIVPDSDDDGGEKEGEEEQEEEEESSEWRGTFASQDPRRTADTTAHAAHAMWHFAQTWMGEFPHFRPGDDRVSLWAESYGGHYGPGIMRAWRDLNKRYSSSSAAAAAAPLRGDSDHEEMEGNNRDAQSPPPPPPSFRPLHLSTLGIINGLVDLAVQNEAAIEFAHNNTYGIRVFNDSVYQSLRDDWFGSDGDGGGCREKVVRCGEALRQQRLGNNNNNNNSHSSSSSSSSSSPFSSPSSCDIEETTTCATRPWLTYQRLRARGWFDIAHPAADPFPPPHMLGYLTQEPVLADLGAAVNYTGISRAVSAAFEASGDVLLGSTFLEDLGVLLDDGTGDDDGDGDGEDDNVISVHMVYGDRDYACNWLGGEAASLAVPWKGKDEFAGRAGYAALRTKKTRGGKPDFKSVGDMWKWEEAGMWGDKEDGVEGGSREGNEEEEEEEEEEEYETTGLTRQLGPLSFTRVFQAGHEVPAYQPSAAWWVFMRATFGRDIATGKMDVMTTTTTTTTMKKKKEKKKKKQEKREEENEKTEGENHHRWHRTEGPSDVRGVLSDMPGWPRPRCYVLKPDTCDAETLGRWKRGEVEARDWFVVVDGEEGERQDTDVEGMGEL